MTVAGGGSFAGDGGPASQALTNRPVGMTFDQHGNLFLAEALHNRIRRIDAQTGIIRTVAGQGVPTPFLDNVPALEATLNLPTHTAVTPEGDLLIADSGNHRIRKLDSSSGALFTIAGTGIGPGISGDGGPATQAQLSTPFGVAVDSTGAVYIADTGNNLVRRIDPVTQIIETVTGLQGPTGVDKGRNTLSIPISVSVDSNDRVLIADRGNHRIVRFSDLGFEVIAGTGISGFSGDGGLPLQASFASPSAVLADFDGNIHILDTANNRLRVIDSKTGLVSTVAGGTCCNLEDGIDPRQANLFSPFGLAADGAGNILISDFQNNLVRRIDAKTGLIGSVLGRGSNGDGSSALGAVMFLPSDVNFDPITLNLIIADREGFRVRELDAKGLIHTLAGNGKTFTFDGAGGTVIGDGLPAVDAAVAPTGIVKTDSGFLLIADSASGRIRGVDREGIINSVLVGLTGFVSMDIDSFENLIVSVSGFNVIVGLTPQGMVLPLAGDSNGASPGFSGDGGPPGQALLNLAGGGGIDIDHDADSVSRERLFVADTNNHRVRVIGNGVIDTFAGNGSNETIGDGGQAAKAGVPLPIAVAYDEANDILYIATLDNRLRSVDSEGVIQTLAGTGKLGNSGDGESANTATFRFPRGMVVDDQGNIFVADQYNYAVRMIRAPTGKNF